MSIFYDRQFFIDGAITILNFFGVNQDTFKPYRGTIHSAVWDLGGGARKARIGYFEID
jgi:hypothetical protein